MPSVVPIVLICAAVGSPPTALFEQARRPLRDVLAPVGLELSAVSCAECHREAFDSWRASMHAASYTDPWFREAYEDLPSPWCLNCHAPLPEQQSELLRRSDMGPLLSEGITCAVCHVRHRRILSARRPTSAGQTAHPMTHAPHLADSLFCAACHQFTAPDFGATPLAYSDFPMQSTFDEWQRSPAADQGLRCHDCHMGQRDGHRMTGGHDPERLRRALAFELDDDGQLVISSIGVGHAIPTGDVFRQLVVETCDTEDCLHPRPLATLARRVIRTPAGLVEDGSRRLLPGQSIVLAVPDGAHLARVRYRWVDDQLPSARSPSASQMVLGCVHLAGPVLILQPCAKQTRRRRGPEWPGDAGSPPHRDFARTAEVNQRESP